MASGVEDLVKILTDMVQDAFTVPLGADKCVLNRDKVLDILEEISATLPSDLKQARTIVESRNEIMSQARREAIPARARNFCRRSSATAVFLSGLRFPLLFGAVGRLDGE